MKSLKILQTLLLTVLSVCFVFFTGNVKADSQTLTIDNYKTYLQQNDSKAYSKYISLSEDKQQQILNALLDPTSYQDVNNWKQTNLAITDRAGGTKNSWGTQTFSIAGFTILEYKVSINYAVEGKKITKIYSSSAYVSRNLNPLLQTGLINKNHWIDGGLVKLTAVFSYDAGPLKGFSVRVGTFNALFAADYTGNSVYNYWYTE